MGKRAISVCLLPCLFALFLNSVSGVTNDPQDQQVYNYSYIVLYISL